MFTFYKATRESKRACGSRKTRLVARTSDAPSVRLNSMWDGGSRDEYTLLRSDGTRVAFPASAAEYRVHWRSNPRDIQDWPIPAGYVVLETGITCGKPSVPAIIGAAEDVNRLLVHWGIDPANPEE